MSKLILKLGLVIVAVLLLGYLWGFGVVDRAIAGAQCCKNSDCAGVPGQSVSCQGVGSPCPNNYGECYYTETACCTNFGSWGSCSEDPPGGGTCYQTRWCGTPAWCSEYEIRQCGCSGPTEPPPGPTPTPTPACQTGTFNNPCKYSGLQWCTEGTSCNTGWVTGPTHQVNCASNEILRDIGTYCSRWDGKK